jgi:hypothetical protein
MSVLPRRSAVTIALSLVVEHRRQRSAVKA